MELDLAAWHDPQHRPPHRPPRHRPDEAVGTRRIHRPITPDMVRRIAHRGDTLREPIEALQLRNRRITLGYSDLSERLASLIAGEGGRRDANWCTYATWSSRTIGGWIREDATHPLSQVPHLPSWAGRSVNLVTRNLANRGGGASYRTLAAGNRIVFREIALVISLFIEAFGDVDRTRPDEAGWGAYWRSVERVVAELARLDASWLPTVMPDVRELRLGLRQYYEALFAPDPKARAELVLAGTLLLAAYEQRRVDGYTAAVLALFTKHAMGRLARHGSGAAAGWRRRLPSGMYSWLATRCLFLSTPDERLWIGRPLPPPPTPSGAALFPTDLRVVTLPLLGALLARYDRSAGRRRRRRMRDWTSFDERMTYITNLLRSRQQHPHLFSPPFPPEIEAALLDGRIEPGPADGLACEPRAWAVPA